MYISYIFEFSIDSCNTLCACIWFSSFMIEESIIFAVTSSAIYKYGYFFHWHLLKRTLFKNVYKFTNVNRIYLLERFFHYVQRINIHKYFFDLSWCTCCSYANTCPKTGRYCTHVDVHFSENASSVNISNVLEQSLMELRHPTSRLKFPLFPFPPWRYY